MFILVRTCGWWSSKGGGELAPLLGYFDYVLCLGLVEWETASYRGATDYTYHLELLLQFLPFRIYYNLLVAWLLPDQA